MASTSSNRGGVGFLGLLTICFIVLKLTGYINWSWWLVISPMLFGVSLVLLFLVVVFTIVMLDVFERRP